jgi:hypothetical protein
LVDDIKVQLQDENGFDLINRRGKMTILEVCVISIISIFLGVILVLIGRESLGEKKNTTPKMNNHDPKFCEVPNILIQ